METWVTVLITVLGSSSLATLISQLFTIYIKKQEAKNGLNQGMRLVLKDRLRSLCVGYIQQGWIYEDELEDIIAMHMCYHDSLGGNGYLDTLMARVKSLPIHGVGV